MNLIKKIKRLFFKDKPKHEPFGIKFRDGNHIGEVTSLIDNYVFGYPAPTAKYWYWDGGNWIAFDPNDPSDGGVLYTFHCKENIT